MSFNIDKMRIGYKELSTEAFVNRKSDFMWLTSVGNKQLFNLNHINNLKCADVRLNLNVI